MRVFNTNRYEYKTQIYSELQINTTNLSTAGGRVVAGSNPVIPTESGLVN